MQANNNMGSPISLLEIKRLFQIPIIKIKPILNFTQYFRAITAYGNMSLLLQSYQNSHNFTHTQYLTLRNRFIHANYKCFPLIYEQHVVQYKNFTLCATLIEDCISLQEQISQDHSAIKSIWFGKLIRSLDLIQKQDLWLKNGLEEKGLLFLTNSQQIVFDFSKIIQHNQEKQSHFDGLIKIIHHLLQKKYKDNKQIHEIIFINGKIYAIQPNKLCQATDYQELLLFLNLCPNLEVQLIAKSVKPLSKNGIKNGDLNKHGIQNGNHENKQLQKKKVNDKIKRMSLKNLEDNPTIRINSIEYKSLIFADGKCLNCLRQIFYEQLSTKFIQECSLYKLQQFQHLVVNIFKHKTTQQSRNEQIVTVYPPVSKSELIGFLIAYIKCIDPIIKSIEYIEGQNTLKIEFENRKKRQKVLRIVFYQEYIVKDQQISMILEKSNLQKCRLDLRNMNISDTFLIFLSHSQKTADISQLYLTNNIGLSDIGLCTFLKSNLSNSLKTLSLTMNNENTLEEALQLISRKQSLQKLYLKKQSLSSSSFGQQIDVSYLKLVQLQSLGLGVTFSSIAKGNLKILRLDQMVLLQELKNIKHLRLTQLKLRLNQNQKKSLMQSFSNLSSLTSSLTSSLSLNGAFNNKVLPARVFAEGQSRQTLRKLDISYSNCKYKSLKPLFQMDELEYLSLEGCIGLGGEYEPICPKILMLSMADVDINQEQLSVMLHNHKELVELNIINAKIVKQDIIQLVSKKKMFIADLIISEHQYSNKLVQMTNGYEFIGCVQLYIQRLLEPQQEYSLNSLLAKASQSEKHVRFILHWKQHVDKQVIQHKKQILMDKINNFLIMSSISIESLRNIYINKMRIIELLEIKQNFQVQDTCESYVASSVSIATQRCKISSSHKIVVRKNNEIPVLFKILQKQTIDKFTHRFVKFMQDNTLPMSVDLSHNKIVGKQIIHILHRYGKKLIKELNFRNCMFGMNNVIDTLFQFQGLEMVNSGHYEIYLNKQNFNSRSQKYLKLFMRTKQVIQLKIHCQQIQEVQILFSVLNHILDQSAPSLQSLYIIFSQMTINKESLSFFKVLFTLSSLHNFQFVLRQCDNIDKRCSQIWFKNFNSLESLQKLSLILPSSSFPLINLPNLKQFYLEFSDLLVDENNMSKCLKNLSNSKNLKTLRISVANCTNISNLNRVFGVIPTGFLLQRLTNLETLSLNFEYCPIKQQSLFDLIVSLPKCQYLKMFELNVSFSITNFNDFLSCIQKLVQDFARPVGIKIICVTQNSSQFMLRTQSLSQKGVQFII